MIKFFQDKLLAGFLIALFGSIITFGYQYLQDSYKQSRLVLDYKHEYSQVGNVSVGNIVIANLGQVSDEDIMVQVDEKVDKYNVQISGASTEPQVKRFNDYTEFVISKLNPFDRISISFTPTSKRSSFEILSFNSKSGKLEYIYYPPEWWELNSNQRNILLATIVTSILGGVLIGRSKLFKKKK